ncbi:MAG: hypothetical protein BWX68_02212 [Verrucomicrobia bacterium ADurb.Bin063]|nr:MAG: hypothetical protein BWX68_02212 [Verrucomicrobia bacterium ADurb.Bin063]
MSSSASAGIEPEPAASADLVQVALQTPAFGPPGTRFGPVTGQVLNEPDARPEKEVLALASGGDREPPETGKALETPTDYPG